MTSTVDELAGIERELRRVEARAIAARDPKARARMAMELSGLKRRIDEFVARPDSNLPSACARQLRTAAAEIGLTMSLLVGPKGGHA
jgi:hypothetical protein